MPRLPRSHTWCGRFCLPHLSPSWRHCWYSRVGLLCCPPPTHPGPRYKDSESTSDQLLCCFCSNELIRRNQDSVLEGHGHGQSAISPHAKGAHIHNRRYDRESGNYHHHGVVSARLVYQTPKMPSQSLRHPRCGTEETLPCPAPPSVVQW